MINKEKRSAPDGLPVKGGFLLRVTTHQGVPLALGGLCEPGSESACMESAARARLDRITFSGGENLIQVDEELARAAVSACTKQVQAVGLAAGLSGYRYSTGGVIGSPHQESVSAAGEMEFLGDGLYLLARPGGPGYVVGCAPELAESLFAPGSPLRKEDITGEQAARYLLESGVERFLVVADGTGDSAQGYVAVFGGGGFDRIIL